MLSNSDVFHSGLNTVFQIYSTYPLLILASVDQVTHCAVRVQYECVCIWVRVSDLRIMPFSPSSSGGNGEKVKQASWRFGVYDKNNDVSTTCLCGHFHARSFLREPLCMSSFSSTCFTPFLLRMVDYVTAFPPESGSQNIISTCVGRVRFYPVSLSLS